MTRVRAFLGASAIALAGIALSGCVAAAIPVIAGGSMLRSEAIGGTDRPEQAPQTALASEPDEPGQSATGLIATQLTELPAPTQGDIRAGSLQRLDARSFDAFYGYALTQATLDALEAPMRSALLANPESLDPVRQDCGARAPVVIVDLDPQGAIFDPSAAGRGSQPLAEVLAVLRSRGITIGWISALPASSEQELRSRLALENLDPAGADRLLLVSDEDTSKQELRVALAETHCPIAIAGDAREDFDELFAYLKNPDAAFTLNEMFGTGWFLTPNPID